MLGKIQLNLVTILVCVISKEFISFHCSVTINFDINTLLFFSAVEDSQEKNLPE